MNDTKQRRWLSFSVKRLLLLVLVTCIACGWFSIKLEKARRQHASVTAIEQLGGAVMYDYQDENRDNPSGPEWLRNLLGRHFFDKAVRVAFSSPGIKNDRVKDISFLSGMTDLKMLYLDWTSVKDISVLSQLHGLKFVSLNYAPVDDLTPLANLTQLETISISRTNVSNLSPLKGLPLKSVWLEGTPVSDISPISVSSLEHLYLYRTGVSDISSLSAAKHLRTLSLASTKVVDLKPLEKLTELKSLDLGRTGVTRSGVDALKLALPECEIAE